ncbi:MAG: helix-turn-helix transcriptional regulator, partial [Saprospiraceae bacterium]|nr:helix-turn-helix transcriptional regulator [Saprospiraceae bacterium]
FSPAILQHGDAMLIYRPGEYGKGEGAIVGDVEFYFEFYAATYTATGAQATGPTFGEALRAYLAATGTTQAELARRIDAHQGHISKYVSGASSPSAGRIEEIASALGCEIARAGGGWKFTELPNFII